MLYRPVHKMEFGMQLKLFIHLLICAIIFKISNLYFFYFSALTPIDLMSAQTHPLNISYCTECTYMGSCAPNEFIHVII